MTLEPSSGSGIPVFLQVFSGDGCFVPILLGFARSTGGTGRSGIVTLNVVFVAWFGGLIWNFVRCVGIEGWFRIVFSRFR